MKGNGIAEIIIEKCYDVKFIDYGHDDLPETERSTREFGSSLGFQCYILINKMPKKFMNLSVVFGIHLGGSDIYKGKN